MNVLYQDEYLIVCVKPSGVLSQGDGKGRANMPSLLSDLLGCEVFPVHRLDFEVSGVMVYAKTQETAAKLSALVPLHEDFRKEYLAVVEGIPAEREAVLEDLLFHDVKRNKSFVVERKRGGVKSARLPTVYLIPWKRSREFRHLSGFVYIPAEPTRSACSLPLAVCPLWEIGATERQRANTA